MSKERRLGRGLEALLGRPADAPHDAYQPDAVPPAPPQLQVHAPEGGLVQLSVYQVDANPFQPRVTFDEQEIATLAESIREHGIIQPIAVRKAGQRYQLVAGERRLRAAIKAGWSEVPAQVLEVGDREASELALVENLHRKDLNPIEMAQSFQQYLERYGCTQEQLASRLQIARSTVTNLIRLLELPDEVRQAVRQGAVSNGHARALLPLGDEREQVEFCRRIQAEGLSVRAVESEVALAIQQADAEPLSATPAEGNFPPPPKSAPAKRTRSSQLASLEQEFRLALGAKVEVRQAARGRGKLVIHFTSHDDFERLRALLCTPSPQAKAG